MSVELCGHNGCARTERHHNECYTREQLAAMRGPRVNRDTRPTSTTWLWAGVVEEDESELADLMIRILDAHRYDFSQHSRGRGGRCDRCLVRPSATKRSLYCGSCAAIVTRERSSRSARAKRKAAKPEPTGRSAEPWSVSHPLLEHHRIPKEHLWLVLGEGSDGGWSVARDLIPGTRAEYRSEATVTDESGLTADNWLAKDGLNE